VKTSDPIEITARELEEFLARVEPAVGPSDYAIIRSLVQTVSELSRLLDDKKTSIARLRQLLFGPATEKTKNVLPEDGKGPKGKTADSKASGKKKRKGHGRNGADHYPGAQRVPVAHASLQPGTCCPECHKGKVYGLRDPARVIRVVGQPFLKATIYEPERLRCNLCGEVFTADLPAEAGPERYDETAGSMVAVLKYGSGLPFNRMEKHQDDLGVPLPASVQWEIVEDVAEKVAPVHQAFIQEAAQGEVVHNDDTNMKILGLTGAASSGEKGPDPPERTGVFTTGIVSVVGGHKVALFFTGRNHAGENLTELLRRRQPELGPPIQMCDALRRNDPAEFATIVANCLAHGRRKFVEVAPSFPAECRYVLDELGLVYRHDAISKARGDSARARLRFHQVESGPVMARLKSWLEAQFAERRVEPNSTLGKAIAYMQNHWERLTLFLRRAGAPLDNNVCERALKMAILHRKNALFYKTGHGAVVGDVLMSLIYTCRMNGANPFEYLTVLLKHAKQIEESPAAWLPWNYKAALANADTPGAA
jgi:transposase